MEQSKVRIYCRKKNSHQRWDDLFTIKKDAIGAPYLLGEGTTCCSISHSGEYDVLAVSDEPIGVDLQVHRGEARGELIANRFFHREEAEYLRHHQSDDSKFYKVWTAKESYVKFTKTGIDEAFGKFSVIAEEFEVNQWNAIGVCFTILPFQQGYTLCVCTKEKIEVEIIWP
ncbi:4'-phosphopantetheinyl transferase [Clostridiales Family XIII bacterium PM5-7]